LVGSKMDGFSSDSRSFFSWDWAILDSTNDILFVRVK
jgi:hypothetical protein